MKRVFAIFIAAGGLAICAQDSPERVTVPFSDPSRPKMVKVSLLNGSITVKGYNGKEAIIESRSRDEDTGRHRRENPPPGMHRIYGGGAGLQAEESENTISIGTERINSNSEITVQVPFETSLKLRTVNGGNIVVENVSGDVDVDNTNGAVTLTHISGSAVAHALNGRVEVTLDKVNSNKAMSFSSLNGNVDVTLPADLKANVKMKTDNGEIYSDFDVKLDASSRQPIVEDNRNGRGRYRVRMDHAVTGTINGGGPELQFTTFNGTIFIRKAK
jgi:Putative adhesin